MILLKVGYIDKSIVMNQNEMQKFTQGYGKQAATFNNKPIKMSEDTTHKFINKRHKIPPKSVSVDHLKRCTRHECTPTDTLFLQPVAN